MIPKDLMKAGLEIAMTQACCGIPASYIGKRGVVMTYNSESGAFRFDVESATAGVFHSLCARVTDHFIPYADYTHMYRTSPMGQCRRATGDDIVIGARVLCTIEMTGYAVITSRIPPTPPTLNQWGTVVNADDREMPLVKFDNGATNHTPYDDGWWIELPELMVEVAQ